jgi:hypothetical protein
MTVLLLTNIDDLPFDPENFAAAGTSLPWTADTPLAKGFQDHSHLKLVANDLQADSAEYDLRFHRSALLGGKGGGAEVQHAYPMITTWVGSKQP